jgi:transcriptional regulator with XRE-family HTH domain
VDHTDDIETWGLFVRDLGHNVALHRAIAGLSQEDVAYRAGISRYAYQKLERGSGRPGRAGNPSLRLVVAVALALDTDLGKLLPELPDILGK